MMPQIANREIGRLTEIETDRQRRRTEAEEGQTEADRQTEIDKQTDRQPQTATDRQAATDRDRQTEGERQRKRDLPVEDRSPK